MENKKTSTKRRKTILINLFLLILIIILLIYSLVIIGILNFQEKVTGKIYFNKPASWEEAYAYLYNGNKNEPLGEWPGVKLTQEQDYIYYFETTIRGKIQNYNVIFNSGEESNFLEGYQVVAQCEGYNKIFNITQGLGNGYELVKGEWLEYSENLKIGKIPTTQKKVKNVIFMIGDGMGENHIIAGGLYKGKALNMQNITNKSYVKTASTIALTESAAAATALATGHKTTNETIGKNKYGNDVENLIEYTNSRGLKTGIVCTQILNHATPAAFSVHNTNRYNYDEIALSQINSCVDLLLGGGRKYFYKYENEMKLNNYKWIKQLEQAESIGKNERIIGTLAEESIATEVDRTSLKDMTKIALSRLENDNGFFLMIEGSDIDSYSHEHNMEKTLIEMIDFDDAVGIAMEYVDNHPDTLLIVTSDHETGGIILDGVNSVEQLTDSLFTSYGMHTEKDVLVYAYGIGAEDLTQYDIIDNTSIHNFIKQALINN